MSKLGIKKDLQSTAGIPVSAPYKTEKRDPMFPQGYWFPLVNLVNVHYDPIKEVKQADGSTAPTPVLSFTFVEKANSAKQITALEFPLEDNDPKFDMKLGALQQRIKHIFEQTVGIEHFKEEEFAGEDFAELFQNVYNAFKSKTIKRVVKEGEEPKEIAMYKGTQLYLKTVYNNARLQIPMFPNFVQKAFNNQGQVPCEFTVNPSYDIFEPKAKATGGLGAYKGGTNTTFGDANDFPEFPDV